MIHFMTLLLVLQLIGEALSAGLDLVLPGPVIGMILLFALLLIRDRFAKKTGRGGGESDPDPSTAGALPPAMERVTGGLLGNLSLLFVPAGVGVIVHIDLLRDAWVPLLGALLVSTLAAIAVTALIVDRLLKRKESRPHG